MKTVDIQETNLDACVIDAQSDRVVIMRGGNPVAIVVGVQGLDEEQAQLGASEINSGDTILNSSLIFFRRLVRRRSSVRTKRPIETTDSLQNYSTWAIPRYAQVTWPRSRGHEDSSHTSLFSYFTHAHASVGMPPAQRIFRLPFDIVTDSLAILPRTIPPLT